MGSVPQPSTKTNLGMLLYVVAIFLGGVAIIGGTFVNDWGFMGYFGGGILTLLGLGMLVFWAMGGLRSIEFDCPACGHHQTYGQDKLAKGRLVPCKGCFAYLEQPGDAIEAVPQDRVAPLPIFEAPLADATQFPGHCAFCGGLPTGTEDVSGTVLKVEAAGKKRITRTYPVPVCDAHRGQQAVAIGQAVYLPGLERFSVSFRSYAACLAFRAANPTRTRVDTTNAHGRGAAA